MGNYSRNQGPTAIVTILMIALLVGATGCSDDDPVRPDLDLKLISGTVVAADTGRPVENALVFLHQPVFGCAKAIAPYPAHQDSVLTDRYGRYNFRIPRGNYFQVYAGREDVGTPVRFSQLTRPLAVDLSVVEAVTLVDIVLRDVVSGGSMSGVTYSVETEEVIAGATIYLSRLEGVRFVSVDEMSTDEAGQFGFSELHTGIYRVWATKEVEIDTYMTVITGGWGPVFMPGKADLGFYSIWMTPPPICLP